MKSEEQVKRLLKDCNKEIEEKEQKPPTPEKELKLVTLRVIKELLKWVLN